MINNTKKYKGSKISQVQSRAGIYAWYYKPLITNSEKLAGAIENIVESSTLNLSTKVSGRYGAQYISNSEASIMFGSREKNARMVIDECISSGEDKLFDFIKSEDLVMFSRPLYIGISKDLYTRTYEQHYKLLQSYWDEHSTVTKYLNANKGACIQDLIDDLDVKHSFALEARIKGIPNRDLLLVVNYHDDGIKRHNSESQRPIEKLLHLITDPVCGRR